MAYLDHDHEHRHKRLAGITGVALVHLVLAAGLTAGLTIKEVLVDQPEVLVGDQIPLPTAPKPTDTPEPAPTPQQRDTRPHVPRPDIAVSSDPIVVQSSDPVESTLPDLVIENAEASGITVLPTPTPSLFTPRNPTPRNSSSSWVTTADYPRLALSRGWEGTVRYQLDISAQGDVESCRIISSSGHDVLDDAACNRIERRARFRPATDRNGMEVAGAYTGSVTWQIPED